MPEFSSTNQPSTEAKKRGWTFRQTMERVLAQENPALGVNDRVPLHERIVRAHISKALDGDMPAVKELYDRVDGKVSDKHELSGPEGKPIEVKSDLETARAIAFALAKGAREAG